MFISMRERGRGGELGTPVSSLAAWARERGVAGGWVWRRCARVWGCVCVQAEDGIRGLVRSRGLGDVYKRQTYTRVNFYRGSFLWHGSPVLLQNTGFYNFCYIKARSILDFKFNLVTMMNISYLV